MVMSQFLWLQIMLDVEFAYYAPVLSHISSKRLYLARHSDRVLQHVCDSYVLSPIHATGALNYPPDMTQGRS